MKHIILTFVSLLFTTGICAQLLVKEEPVVLKTTTGEIFGTLKIPYSKVPVPVAIIIAGSGPTDRNGNQASMKSDTYKMLSDGLYYKGIATLSFDKRGIGESKSSLQKEEDVTLDTFIEDVRQWIILLKNDDRFSQIALIGHSEGSLIGIVAAKDNPDVSKFVSLAGAGESLDVILKKQLEERMAGQPEVARNMVFSYIDRLKKGETFDDVPPGLNSLFRRSVQPFLISSFRYDPQVEIAQLKIPFLIVSGTYDIQISPDQADLLANANHGAQKLIIDNMDHVLKYSESKDVMEQVSSSYNNPNRPIVADVIKRIAEFLK